MSGNAANRRSRAVIENDRQIRYIRSALVNLNDVDIELPSIVKDKGDEPNYHLGEIVWVQLLPISDQKASMKDVLS